MMIKNYATMKSPFPDDSVEEAGDIVVPTGRTLATAIANGIPSATAPFQRSFYGWEFGFTCPSGRRAWVVLQDYGPCLLIVDARVGWFASAKTKVEAHAEAVAVVQSALSLIEGLSEIEWQICDEFTQRSSKQE